MKRIWLSASVCFLLALVAIAARADWPDYRGPYGDGHVSAPGDNKPVGLPTEWSETKNVKAEEGGGKGKPADRRFQPCLDLDNARRDVDAGCAGAQGGFAFDELGEVVEMGDCVFGGGGGQGLAVFFEEGQAQGVEVGVKGGEVGFGFHRLS